MMGPCIMHDLGKRNFQESLRMLTRVKERKALKDVERQVDNIEITIILRQNFNNSMRIDVCN